MKIEQAQIIENKEIARRIWQMEMIAPHIIGEVKGPGQFVNILIDKSWDLPLRRPMSIAGITNDHITIIYKIIGEGTKRLSQKIAGEYLNVLGPLGNTFDLQLNSDSHPILVGGGIGIAPILWIHTIMNEKNVSHDLIFGAVTSSEHFLHPDPSGGVHITTDDGTLGEKGTVMPALKKLILEKSNCSIYSCGPEPMLRAIHQYVSEKEIHCQMALESYMACGLGICQGCAIERIKTEEKEHCYHEKFSLVCREGPVYNAKSITLEYNSAY